MNKKGASKRLASGLLEILSHLCPVLAPSSCSMAATILVTFDPFQRTPSQAPPLPFMGMHNVVPSYPQLMKQLLQV